MTTASLATASLTTARLSGLGIVRSKLILYHTFFHKQKFPASNLSIWCIAAGLTISACGNKFQKVREWRLSVKNARLILRHDSKMSPHSRQFLILGAAYGKPWGGCRSYREMKSRITDSGDTCSKYIYWQKKRRYCYMSGIIWKSPLFPVCMALAWNHRRCWRILRKQQSPQGVNTELVANSKGSPYSEPLKSWIDRGYPRAALSSLCCLGASVL